jgi:hypothetical protein
VDREELAGAMLVQSARQRGAQNVSAKLVAGETLRLVEKSEVDVVYISVWWANTEPVFDRIAARAV